MTYLPYRGFMIPGLYFDSDYCLWLLHWETNPTRIQPLTELWVITPDQEKICCISAEEGIPVFREYHAFDQVVPAAIQVRRDDHCLKVEACSGKRTLAKLSLRTRFSLPITLLNLLLQTLPSKGEHGRTETGKHYHNVPSYLEAVAESEAEYQGKPLGRLIAPRREIRIGDGRVSRRPLVNHCTHLLEA